MSVIIILEKYIATYIAKSAYKYKLIAECRTFRMQYVLQDR